jgi:peptide-methionine (S)-S-oxide reductase
LNKSQLCLLIVHIALVQSIGENYPMSQTAYFATGCFWGAERRFWNLDGVIQTSVGYMGGNKPDPTYKEVCTGTTNHAEIVEVIFDPQLISYKRLLAEFWVMHDPTSLNQQGGDIGTQYRSAIFTTSAEQMQQVLESKEIYQGELSKNEIGKIVTQILPAAGVTYWLAEEYHQRYLEKNPNGYDCHSSTGVAFPSALMSNNG